MRAWWERLRLATVERNSERRVRTTLPRSLAIQGSLSVPKPKQEAQGAPTSSSHNPPQQWPRDHCLLEGRGQWPELSVWAGIHTQVLRAGQCAGGAKGQKREGPGPGPRARSWPRLAPHVPPCSRSGKILNPNSSLRRSTSPSLSSLHWGAALLPQACFR